jgi:alpha-2-macroglobulin
VGQEGSGPQGNRLMPRNIFSFICLILLTLSCQATLDDPATEQYLKQYTDQKAPLKVDYYQPEEGKVGISQNKIVIHFTQPMVPLSALGEEVTTDLVKIDPLPEGYFKWVNTKTLVYQVKGNLPYSTDFLVKVYSGKPSLLGFAMVKDMSLKFNTPAPTISTVSPARNKPIFLDQGFVIGFNQDIDITSQKSLFTLIHEKYDFSNKGSEIALEVACYDAEKRKPSKESICKKVWLKPKSKLSKKMNVILKILKGVDGVQGTLKMVEDHIYSFYTYGDFQVLGLKCEYGCKPRANLMLSASTEIEEEGFEKFIEFEPKRTVLNNMYAYWSRTKSSLNFYPSLNPDTEYKVIIKPGLKDRFGQVLKERKEFSFHTGDLDDAIHAAYVSHRVMNAGAKIDLGFAGINLRTASSFYKTNLSDKNIIQFLDDARTTMRTHSKDMGYWQIRKDFKTQKRNKKIAFSVPVGEVLKNNAYGIVLSDYISDQLTRYDSKTKTYFLNHDWTLTQITDLAIDANISAKNGLVWITSLSTGKNVPGAKVLVYDENANLLHTALSNAQGAVKIPGYEALSAKAKSLNKDGKFGEDIFVFVSKGKDRAYLYTEWSSSLGFYSYDMFYDMNHGSGDSTNITHKARLHMLTDRGLYKPGEEVKIKGYLRTVTDQGLKPYSEALILDINIPNEDKNLKIPVVPNKRGNFTASYKVPKGHSLGDYWVSVYPRKTNIEIDHADVRFQVQKFRTPDFKVTVTPAKKLYFKKDTVQNKIAGEYLFGAPMKGAKLEYYVNKNVTSFNPPNDRGFNFGRTYEHKQNTSDLLANSYDEETVKLNSSGEFDLKVEAKIDALDPINYVFEADVYDLSGQQQSSRSQVTVHPASFYVGAKLGQFFYDAGDEMPAQFALYDPLGKLVTGYDVTVDLMRVKWVSVKRKTLDGQFETKTERKEEKVASCSQKAISKDNSCSLVAKDSGYYIFKLSAKDAEGRLAVTELSAYVEGESYAYWPEEDSHRVELVKDKKNYKLGETAKILIKSPYEKSHALIAIERDKIISYEIKELVGSTPVIDIPIQAKHVPNIFVKIILIRGSMEDDPSHTSKDKKAKQQALVKVGKIELKVAPQGKDLALEVKPQQTIYKPGEEASIDIQVTGVQKGAVLPGAELTVMVVDEGVLLAGGYKLKDPLKTFFAPYRHKVLSSDSRTHYVGMQGLGEKMEDPSSGGGKSRSFRKKFIPLAFYQGALETDATGKATVKFTVPDQLTNFKVMVIANANVDQFGLGMSEFQTQKAIMIRPALPRFIRAGDVFDSKVVIHNNSDTTQEVALTVNAENLTIVSKPKKVSVPAKSSKAVVVQFKSDTKVFAEAIDNKVMAKVEISAEANGVTDDVQISLPIYWERLIETVATSGVVFEEVSEFVTKDDNIAEDVGSLDIRMSANILAKLKDKIKALRLYPYDCLEQRMSKVYPFVLFSEDKYFSDKDHDASSRFDTIHNMLKDLRSRQNYRGEQKFWPASSDISPSLTVEVAEFVYYAGKMGHKVEGLQKKLKKRLKAYVQGTDYKIRSYSVAYKLKLKLNSLYVLYLMGEAQPSQYLSLKVNWDSLGPIDQAKLVEMAHTANMSDPIIKRWKDGLKGKLRIKGRVAYIEAKHHPYYFGNTTKVTTSRVLQTLLKVDPAHPFLFQMLLGVVNEKKSGSYISSRQGVAILKVLKAYQETFALATKPVNAKLFMNDKEVIQSVLDFDKPQDELSIPVAKLPENVKLKFKKESGHVFFYDMKYHYALKKFRPFGLEQGISIHREYHDLEGGKVLPKDLKHGETYKVILNFFFADNTDYLVVEEPIAAGLEPINFALKNVRRSLRNKNSTSSSFSWRLTHREFHDKKILLFADHINRGFYEFSYFVNVTNAGNYLVPPAKAMEMYDPEVFGTTGVEEVVAQ